MPRNSDIQFRRGTNIEWNNADPVLNSGEPGFDVTNDILKIGDGSTSWTGLPEFAPFNTNLIAGSGISLVYNSGNSTLSINSSGTGGGLANIVEDLTPQLGGNLDLNSSSITGVGNINISGDTTANTGNLDVLSFNVNNESILTKGQLSWDDTEGTLDIGLTDNTSIHIGEHRYFRIRNQTGGILYKGQVVYATGVHSNGLITPAKYVADGTVREVRFMGVVLEDVNDNNNGYVIDFGHLENMDLDGSETNYAVGDETWSAGDILYVHPTVVGKLTKNEPKHSITVAIILDVGNGNGNGRMFVRPTSYGHLDDNHDVAVSGATNGQFLQYNSVTDYWVPSSSGNFTTLQVNGTSVPTGVGTSNYVTKWTGTNSIGNSVVYDNGTNVGIGTASPAEKLYVNGSIGNLGWRINEGAITTTGAGVGNGVAITLNNQFGTTLTTTLQYKVMLTTYGTSTKTGATYIVWYNTLTSAWVLREVGLEGNTSNHPLLAESGGELIAYTNSSTGYGIRYLVESYNTADADSKPNSIGADYHWQRLADNLYYIDGNVSIGTTTAANRLTVDGGNITFNEAGGNYDFRVEGDTDANLLFTDASTDRVGIGTSSPSYKLDVVGTGNFSQNLLVNGTPVSVSGHVHTTGDITGFASGVADVVNTTLIAGTGIDFDYNAGTDSLTINGLVLNQTVNGRLTLESGVPISTTGQTAKTTLYFTPYLGNQIALYDGTEWKIYTFSELSLSLSGYTANTNYDIFIYDNSGTLTLESTAWTNNTTRATSLVTQDGVYVKSGATTRRYLGTIRTTATTGQCEDSDSRRFVWNFYNQTERLLSANYNAPHSYTTSTWRPWNNNTTIGQTRVDFVRGLNLSVVNVQYWSEAIGSYTSAVIDSTTTGSAYLKAGNSLAAAPSTAADVSLKYNQITAGYHYLQATEYGLSGSTSYYLGIQASFLG